MRFSHPSLLGKISFLAILTNIVFATANSQSFFLDVQLSDAYTDSTNCTDPNHWFLVEADVFVPQGPNRDIYLTVPEEFTSIPKDSFSLKANSKTIGSVTSRSNRLRISYSGPQSKNMTASLNFLVQLSDDAKKQIKSPGSRNYTFEVSTGSTFTRSINYVAKDLTSLTSNGGIYAENNTAWFTADIPLSMLNRPVSFTSSGSNNATYQFDTTRTSLEIIVAVDAFNRPLRSFPFTAVKDTSDSSQIHLLVDSKFDGGKYLRVKYYTKPLKSATIGNTISLTLASGLSKRDNALTINSNLYTESQANIQYQGSAEDASLTEPSLMSAFSASNEVHETYSLETKTEPGVFTVIGSWVPISTLSKTQSATSSKGLVQPVNSRSSASGSRPSMSFSASLASKASRATSSLISVSASESHLTSRMKPDLSQSSSSSFSSSHSKSSATISAVSSADKVPDGRLFGLNPNSSETRVTYSLITMTLNGEAVTLTSLYPISTISESDRTQGYYLNSTTSVLLSTATTDSASSHSTTMVSSAESTVTASPHGKSSINSTKLSSKLSSAESASSNATVSSRNTEIASISSDTESFQTYSVVSKEGGAVVTSYISLRAISTLDSVLSNTERSTTGSSSVVEPFTSVKNSGAGETTQRQHSVTSFPETSPTYLQSTSITTKNVPAANYVSSSNSSSQASPSRLSTLMTKAQPVSAITSPPFLSTKASMITATNGSASLDTSFNPLAIQTQLTSAEETFTSLALTMFEARANRALTGSTGIAGIFLSFILLWI